jgi:hypothetical protein
MTLKDTVVAGSGSTPDVALPLLDQASASFSLIRNAGPISGGSAISTDGTDKVGVDPKLGPLTMNGGPTPTMVPLPSSPVLDQGKSFGLTTDQRGLPRPVVLPTISTVPAGGDHSDIGAVEVRTGAVMGVAPNFGPVGTQVQVTGTGFTGATRVMFGDKAAGSYTVVNDGTITAKAPAQNGGSVDIRVISPLGASAVVGADRFTFTSFTAVVSKPHAKLSGKKVKTGITIACPGGGLGCSASYRATAFVKHHKTKLDGSKVNLSSGRHKTLSFRLSNKAFRALKTAGKLKITVQITITVGDGQPVTVNRSFTIKHK